MIKPFQVQGVTTSYDGTNIKVSWLLPYTGGNGIAVTSYDILLMKVDGSQIRFVPNCDGNSTTIVN